MKIAILYGAFCLTFRGTLPFADHREDPRGLTGSEYGFIRIAEELVALGHDVTAFTASKEAEYHGIKIRPIADIPTIDSSFDVAISINEPEALRDCKAKLRVCEHWLNSFDYCKVGFEKHVDLWCSPSQGHLDMILRETHEVEVTPQKVGALYRANAKDWVVIPLGCDPQRYTLPVEKIPGRVVYCSSPDRGLHWLLQEWPAIKRAVPHATLKIFYRLRAWIDNFLDVDYTPPIEMLRSRAVYVDECLRRMSGPEWGITVCDSVSREEIEREMCLAQVLAYPCDTVRWSEGFSCTILEACAAKACPVITDCDALGEIYRSAAPIVAMNQVDWVNRWRDAVILYLGNAKSRELTNRRAHEFAEWNTWRLHAERLVEAIRKTQCHPTHHWNPLEQTSQEIIEQWRSGKADEKAAPPFQLGDTGTIYATGTSRETLEQWIARRNERHHFDNAKPVPPASITANETCPTNLAILKSGANRAAMHFDNVHPVKPGALVKPGGSNA